MNLAVVWNSLLMSFNMYNHPEVRFQRMGTLVFSLFPFPFVRASSLLTRKFHLSVEISIGLREISINSSMRAVRSSTQDHVPPGKVLLEKLRWEERGQVIV